MKEVNEKHLGDTLKVVEVRVVNGRYEIVKAESRDDRIDFVAPIGSFNAGEKIELRITRTDAHAELDRF